jgi:flagellar biosynthesis/type III secretory pathway chaperone
LETAAKYIDRHSQAIEQNAERNAAEIRDLRTSINDVLQLFSELAAYQRQSQERSNRNEEIIRQNQEEIRRIWEYLLNQRGNGSSAN